MLRRADEASIEHRLLLLARCCILLCLQLIAEPFLGLFGREAKLFRDLLVACIGDCFYCCITDLRNVHRRVHIAKLLRDRYIIPLLPLNIAIRFHQIRIEFARPASFL